MAAPSSLGYGALDFIHPLGLAILDFFDFITNSVMMPIVAFFTCLLIGWVVGPKYVTEEVKRSSAFKREKIFVVVIKYIAPICIALILVSSILDTLGIATI